jgi:TATA-box binding protein (TBP) (component of TFIID and TFIIIB)
MRTSHLVAPQLAEAIPVEGSGITLPLDLHRIAARCKNSFYAPKKFSAVQLAYSEPRCRVLIFRESATVSTDWDIALTRLFFLFADTGRMVGTGTRSRNVLKNRT